MAYRPGATARATQQIGGRRHWQPQLAVSHRVGTNHEPGHTHQRRRTAATSNHRQGPLFLQTSNPQNDEALRRVSLDSASAPGTYSAPHFIAESHQSLPPVAPNPLLYATGICP